MKRAYFLIFDPAYGYLDDFDGKMYGWTRTPRTAWSFTDKRQTERKLAILKRLFPNATIVTRQSALVAKYLVN